MDSTSCVYSINLRTKSDILLVAFMLGDSGSRRSPYVPIHIVNSLLRHVRDPAYERTQAFPGDGALFLPQFILLDPASFPCDVKKRKLYWTAIRRLLRNEEFLPRDISIADGATILRLVAEAKRRVVEECSFQKYSNLFSEVVLERSAELLVEEALEEFPGWIPGAGHENVQCAAQNELKTMSLVHRSWTSPAQRAMRIAVNVRSVPGLYRFLMSPVCGPWLRVFRYETYDAQPVSAMETTQLLAAVMDMAWNLERVYIDPFNVNPRIRYQLSHGFVDSDIFSSPSTLTNLRQLFLEAREPIFVDQLWSAISSMPSLKDLTIRNLPCRDTDDERLANLSSLPAPRCLESVDLICGYDVDGAWAIFATGACSTNTRITAAFVAWLVRPRPDHSVKYLRMPLEEIFHVPREQPNTINSALHAAILPALPGLSCLVLDGVDWLNWTVSSYQALADNLVHHCTSLRSLEVSLVHERDTEEKLKQIRPLFLTTLETIVLRIVEPPARSGTNLKLWAAWASLDAEIAELMTSRSSLRLIHLKIERRALVPVFFTITELLAKSSSLALRHRIDERKPDLRLESL